MEKITKFDILDYLKTEEDFQIALQVACEDDPGDGSLIAATLGYIAKARGMARLAKETGLSREGLYRALSGRGNPEFATIFKVSRALGFPLFSCGSNNIKRS